MSIIVAALHGAFIRLLAAGVMIVCLAGCGTTSRHHFGEASADWRTRSGQLLYRSGARTIIGEVIVRFSRQSRDFELTFSKGPGVALFSIREDASFAQASGALAGRGWAGEINRAPPPLRGWLQLRDRLLSSDLQPGNKLSYNLGDERWDFRF